MKWRRGHVSANVEDRRGQRVSPGVKLGGLGTVVGIVVLLVFGQDYLGVLSGGASLPGMSASQPGPGGGAAPGATDADRELVEFVSFALDDIQASWTARFRARGDTYPEAQLVLFEGATEAGACGLGQAAMGPFYCPATRKAYIDLSFYRELSRKYGAPGDFAQAYVLAHEIGHHVQNVLGTNEQVRAEQRRDPARQNELSVRQELQADCFAGLWAHDTARRDLLERGDIQEGLDAAAAIGDDTLQKKATGRVQPESWTHGSSKQRMRWFMRGYEKGTLEACDTFAAREL